MPFTIEVNGVAQPQRSIGGGSSTLPALSADDFADLAARRRAATRQFQDAQIRRDQQAGRLQAKQTLGLSDLSKEFATQRSTLMDALGDKGLAFQPRFAGKGQRELRDLEARGRADIRSETADRLAALDQMVADARSRRTSELALIDADETRRRTRLSELLQMIGA